VNTSDCSLATPFIFDHGTLSSGGQLISTDPGVTYQPFAVNPDVGSITTTFAVEGNTLVWYNESFVNNYADSCQDTGGQVWVIFDGNPPPFDCSTIVLVTFESKFKTAL
jgi:hypothetical protein